MRLKIFILLVICSSCSGKKITNSKAESINRMDIHLIKGSILCPSDQNKYSSDGISVDFDKSMCEIFEENLDDPGETVIWYMEWLKKGNEYWPINSTVKYYKFEKVTDERHMSFKTGPFVTDEIAFRKSIYYQISQLNSEFKLEKGLISKPYFGVLFTIKKE